MTAARTAAMRTALFFALATVGVVALETVPGSSCADICQSGGVGSIEDDVVCLDDDFQSTASGATLQKCIGCQLNSTAVDPANNITDIDWALFSMRFVLSECMFGFPEQHVSISSPCQVTCQPLSVAVGYQLSNNTSGATPNLGYCTAGQFDDTTINQCAFCYGFIPQQIFMANFLQALHVACRQPPVPGQVFFPDARTIFNESVIQGPTSSSSSGGTSSGLHGWQLGLAIALPIVGGITLIALSCFGCYIFTRRRRRRMAESGRMSRVHGNLSGSRQGYYSDEGDAYQDPHGDSTQWAAHHQAVEMSRISPGLAQSSPAHDDVGPGDGQRQDHQLHDEFFGTPTRAEYEVGQAVPLSPQTASHVQEPPPREDRISPASATSRHSQVGPSFAQRARQQEQEQQYRFDPDLI